MNNGSALIKVQYAVTTELLTPVDLATHLPDRIKAADDSLYDMIMFHHRTSADALKELQSGHVRDAAYLAQYAVNIKQSAWFTRMMIRTLVAAAIANGIDMSESQAALDRIEERAERISQMQTRFRSTYAAAA